MMQPASSQNVRLGEVFDQLRDPIRRRILAKLLEEKPRDREEFRPIDLAEEGEDLPLLESVLHHNHLPKLSEAGFIDWNSEMNTFRRGPCFDEIAPLLRLMDEHEDELPEDWP